MSELESNTSTGEFLRNQLGCGLGDLKEFADDRRFHTKVLHKKKSIHTYNQYISTTVSPSVVFFSTPPKKTSHQKRPQKLNRLDLSFQASDSTFWGAYDLTIAIDSCDWKNPGEYFHMPRGFGHFFLGGRLVHSGGLPVLAKKNIGIFEKRGIEH